MHEMMNGYYESMKNQLGINTMFDHDDSDHESEAIFKKLRP